VSLDNSTTHTHQKKLRLRDRTGRAWFSRLLRHPARKWSGSILTTPEPAWGHTPFDEIGIILIFNTWKPS